MNSANELSSCRNRTDDAFGGNGADLGEDDGTKGLDSLKSDSDSSVILSQETKKLVCNRKQRNWFANHVQASWCWTYHRDTRSSPRLQIIKPATRQTMSGSR